MKPGDQFLMLFEVKRLAESGEVINGIDCGSNKRQNLWVAESIGGNKFKIIVCSDNVPITSLMEPFQYRQD